MFFPSQVTELEGCSTDLGEMRNPAPVVPQESHRVIGDLLQPVGVRGHEEQVIQELEAQGTATYQGAQYVADKHLRHGGRPRPAKSQSASAVNSVNSAGDGEVPGDALRQQY